MDILKKTRGEHRKKEGIRPNPVSAEPLTAYDEEFFIAEVKEGEDVLIGKGLSDGDFYLRCDFSAFEDKLKDVNPTKLEELFVQMGKLEKECPGMDEDTRRFLHTCWRAARITRKMLGELGSEFTRNMSFSEFKVKGQKYCVKPLSECQNQAACSEYSLMAHFVLKKLGVQSSVVVGAFSDDPDDTLADRHTFLVLEGGSLVFDPTHAAGEKDSWPPKVFTAERPLTPSNLQDVRLEGETIGHKIRCIDMLTKEVRLYGSGAV